MELAKISPYLNLCLFSKNGIYKERDHGSFLVCFRGGL